MDFDHLTKFTVMKHLILIFSFAVFATITNYAQGTGSGAEQGPLPEYDQEQLWIKHMQGDKNVLRLEIIDGDTIPVVNLEPIAVIERRFKDPADRYAFLKLKRNIIKVYPYAKEAARLMAEIEETTADIEKKRKKKKYIKGLEKDLKVQFEDKLKKLTVSQGKVLMKLVERESGRTTHDMISDYKSGVSAFFWQQLGKRYGYDLKEGYDPAQNRDMEIIINNLETMGEFSAMGVE